MPAIGTRVQCPQTKSFGIVQKECVNSGPDRYEVRISARAVKSHHKDGDIVIWEIKDG